MAVILDVRSIIRDRFERFAKEYLDIPHTFYCCDAFRMDLAHVVIGYLVEKGVFTVQEIQAEMKSRKIYLGADIYKMAIEEIKKHKERK